MSLSQMLPTTVFVSLLLTGCVRKQSEAKRADKDDNVRNPIVFVYTVPAKPVPGRSLGETAGVVAAIWNDGRIVRSQSSLFLSATVHSGQVDSDGMTALRDQIKELLTQPEARQVTRDAQSRIICIDNDRKLNIYSHGISKKPIPESHQRFIDFIWGLQVLGANPESGSKYVGFPNDWM